MKVPALALFVLGLAAIGTADAQPIHRCGNAYSAVPCAGGRVVEATDEGSAARRSEGLRVAEADRRLAAKMRRDRLADEKALRSNGPASLSGPAVAVAGSPKPAAGAKRKKAKRTGSARTSNEPTPDFVAHAPKAVKPAKAKR